MSSITCTFLPTSNQDLTTLIPKISHKKINLIETIFNTINFDQIFILYKALSKEQKKEILKKINWKEISPLCLAVGLKDSGIKLKLCTHIPSLSALHQKIAIAFMDVTTFTHSLQDSDWLNGVADQMLDWQIRLTVGILKEDKLQKLLPSLPFSKLAKAFPSMDYTIVKKLSASLTKEQLSALISYKH